MRTLIGAFLLSILVCNIIGVTDSPIQQPLGHIDGEASKNGLPFSTSALEEYIKSAMEKWHAPGMAVAIINGNETWAKVSLSHHSHLMKAPFPSSSNLDQVGEVSRRNSSHISTPRASGTPPSPQHQ